MLLKAFGIAITSLIIGHLHSVHKRAPDKSEAFLKLPTRTAINCVKNEIELPTLCVGGYLAEMTDFFEISSEMKDALLLLQNIKKKVRISESHQNSNIARPAL